MQRKEALTVVNEFKREFEQFNNCKVCISFGRFNFCNIVVSNVVLDTVTSFSMKALILDENGKTKPIWTIITNEAKLTATIEDTKIVAIRNGIRLIVGGNEINITRQ